MKEAFIIAREEPITLNDIADVKIGYQEPKLGTAAERGKPAVLLTVSKQPETGTIDLTHKIEAALADVQKNLPADVTKECDTRHIYEERW